MALTKISTKMLKATGVPDSSTYLRGDGVWATPDGNVSSAPASSLTKIDLPMIDTIGTQSSSSFFRGDGVWTGFNSPIWVNQSGSIAIANEQAVFAANLLAVDPNGLTLTYTVNSGALPSGLVLNSSTGVISGTTPMVTSNTVYLFTISASNGNQSTPQQFTMTVNNSTNEPPTWSTAAGSIGSINMNSSFNYSLSATDPNSDPITYSLISGSLPAGLIMSSLGVITGTAANVGTTTTSNFTIRATDSNSGTTDREFSITVVSTVYLITNSLRVKFGNNLSRIPTVNSTSNMYTISCWVKRGDMTANSYGMKPIYSSNGDRYDIDDRSGVGNIYTEISGSQYYGSSPSLRDPSAWYHIVISVDTPNAIEANRLRVYVNNVLQPSSYYGTIPQNTATQFAKTIYTQYIGRTFNNGQQFDGYYSDYYVIDGAALAPTSFGKFDSNLNWVPVAYTNMATIPTAVSGTDIAATTGTPISSGDYGGQPASAAFDGNLNTFWGSAQLGSSMVNTAYIGKDFGTNTVVRAVRVNTWGWTGVSIYAIQYWDGTTWQTTTSFQLTGDYVYRIINVPSNPGGTKWRLFCTATTQPAGGNNCMTAVEMYTSPPTISNYGTNGFHLEFKNSSNLGLDTSGNGNNWILNNITAADQMSDTPTNNYCTMNPLIISKEVNTYGSVLTYQNGNLKVSRGVTWGNGFGSMPMSESGSYFELSAFDNGGGYGTYGITSTENISSVYNTNSDYYYNPYDGTVFYQSGPSNTTPTTVLLTSTAYGSTPVNVGIAYKNGKLYFRVNGSWLNNADPANETGYVVSGLNGKTWLPSVSFHTAGATMNFGATPFTYTIPTGFNPMCSNNLPAVAITAPSSYMNAVLWSGNSSTQSISTGFQPDMLWVKRRNDGLQPAIVDSMRGTTVFSSPSTNSAETAEASITGFTPTGFNLGATMSGTYSNTSGYTYMGFAWKKGVTPGFDVVIFNQASTTTTTSHALGTTPAMIIVKDRQGTSTWSIYHKSLSSPKDMYMTFQPSTPTGTTSIWGTGPTSTQFTTTSSLLNVGNNCVAYLWAEIPGFSKFSSYTGNGAQDGVFVYCGFKPRWIFFHGDEATQPYIFDTARDTYNPVQEPLLTGGTGLGTITPYFDVLSNGFKFRNGSNPNGGLTYFAAFAEHPFGGSNVSPATAR